VIRVHANAFPWATFWTNVSGSLALGLFLTLVLERFPPSRYLRPFVATGFMGAYTTYSTFAVETDLLVKNGHAAVGLAYALASLGAGLGAVWAGMWVARLPTRLRRRER
ncbi:MAG TPA: CrcB family protein, partial [Actinomycetota bacterium]